MSTNRRRMKSPNKDNRERSQVEIRELEIDDVSAVYHLGAELFTSEEFQALARKAAAAFGQGTPTHSTENTRHQVGAR